jgi:hypothetical protein
LGFVIACELIEFSYTATFALRRTNHMSYFALVSSTLQGGFGPDPCLGRFFRTPCVVTP